MFGVVVRRRQGEECLGFSPRGSDTGESVSRALWSLTGYLLSCGCVLFFTPRLYSCLANGSADEFQRGDQLFRMRAVKDPLQIGKGPIMPCGTPCSAHPLCYELRTYCKKLEQVVGITAGPGLRAENYVLMALPDHTHVSPQGST